VKTEPDPQEPNLWDEFADELNQPYTPPVAVKPRADIDDEVIFDECPSPTLRGMTSKEIHDLLTKMKVRELEEEGRTYWSNVSSSPWTDVSSSLAATAFPPPTPLTSTLAVGAAAPPVKAQVVAYNVQSGLYRYHRTISS
jgi:hypothetical protein